MNVGFDAKRAFHNFRGLGNYSRTLIGNLIRYYSSNQYFAYTPSFKDKRASVWQNQVPALKTRTPTSVLGKAFPSLWRSKLMLKEVMRDEVALYHGLHHELPSGIEKSGIKTVVTVHDVLFMRFPQFHNALNREVYRRKLLHSCQVADTIIAISEQTRKDIVEFLKIDPGKIEVVYQTCNEVYFQTLDQMQLHTVKTKLKLPEHYFFYIGALTKAKNVHNLIKAFAQVKTRYPEYHLVIAGEGSYKNELLALVDSLSINSHVSFIGYLGSDTLPAVYQMATAFVFPTLFEGFGIPIIEALASGTPVITSEGSCFPEAAGPDSLFVEPENPEAISLAMIRVVEETGLREKMSKSGSKYVQKFRAQIVTDDVMKIYHALVAL